MIPGNTQHFQEKCAGKHTLPFTDYLECTHPDSSEDYTLITKQNKWNQCFFTKEAGKFTMMRVTNKQTLFAGGGGRKNAKF